MTPGAFARQMRWLSAAGFRTIGLDEVCGSRESAIHVSRRSVVITFDDGFQDTFDHAVPILRAHNFSATFFVVTGLMGQTSRWLPAERGVEFPLFDWSSARRLEEWGFQCGSHSETHPRLAQVSEEECRSQLRESRLLLEDHLGHEIRHLAYPFGSVDRRVRDIAAEAGYTTACTVRPGRAGPASDTLALPRVPVTGQDSLVDFVCRLATARSVRGLVRAGVRRARRWLPCA